MNCRLCGYQLGPFDITCPKCAKLAQSGPVQHPGTVANQQGVQPGVANYAPAAGAPYKVCPNCRQPAVLALVRCGRCGLQFPTVGAVCASMPPNAPPSSPVAAYLPKNHPAQRHASQSRAALARTRRSNYALIFIPTIFGALFVIGAISLFPRHRGDGASGLLFMNATGSQGGSGLTEAPAVNAQQVENRLLQARAVTGGAVEVSLAWNTLTDLDIQVRDSFGYLITAKNPRSPNGGVQDVDANPTPVTMEGSALADAGQNPGIGNVLPIPEIMVDLDEKLGTLRNALGLALPHIDGKAPPQYTHSPVEHIYFEHAPAGSYTVYASCYMWREPSSTPLPFTVEIKWHGKVARQVNGAIGPGSYITTNAVPLQVCQFQVR